MGSTFIQPETFTKDDHCMFTVQLVSASVLPMALRAALELGVLEIIAKAGPGAHLSPSEIASHLPTQNSDASTMLDRVLRLLASHSILTSTLVSRDNGHMERLYGLAPACKFLVTDDKGVSMASVLLMNTDRVFMETWYHLKDAILDGGVPFNKAHGMSAFEYPRTDPRFNKVFNQAMSNFSKLIMKDILETYKGFEGLKVLVDVGGGLGTSLSMIISKYPNLKGINFDLPHVVESAPTYLGVEHVGGDMFVSVPSGDAIFMKKILHDWSDEHCLKILKNCYKALPESGKVVIVDCVLPMVANTDRAATGSFQVDVLMMAYNPGGKERTVKEFEDLAKRAGFAGIDAVCTAFNSQVIEFYKTM